MRRKESRSPKWKDQRTYIRVWTQVVMLAEESNTPRTLSQKYSTDHKKWWLNSIVRQLMLQERNNTAFCPSCNPLLWFPLRLNRWASCTAPQQSSSIPLLLPTHLKRAQHRLPHRPSTDDIKWFIYELLTHENLTQHECKMSSRRKKKTVLRFIWFILSDLSTSAALAEEYT